MIKLTFLPFGIKIKAVIYEGVNWFFLVQRCNTKITQLLKLA